MRSAMQSNGQNYQLLCTLALASCANQKIRQISTLHFEVWCEIWVHCTVAPPVWEDAKKNVSIQLIDLIL